MRKSDVSRLVIDTRLRLWALRSDSVRSVSGNRSGIKVSLPCGGTSFDMKMASSLCSILHWRLLCAEFVAFHLRRSSNFERAAATADRVAIAADIKALITGKPINSSFRRNETEP